MKPVAGAAQIDGFTAMTRVSTMVQGEYTAQVTRQLPAIAGAPGVGTKVSKQALIGTISTPSFLAPRKKKGKTFFKSPLAQIFFHPGWVG
jgi:hypothetical protein